MRTHWKKKLFGWAIGAKPSLDRVSNIHLSCFNHTDGNGNSIHSVKEFACWAVCKYWSRSPKLGTLPFLTLFSEKFMVSTI